MANHLKLFKGLGELGEYQIKLKPDTRPFALSTPRRVAIPLMPKSRQCWSQWKRQDIISKVEQPTDWCPDMNGCAQVQWQSQDLCRPNKVVKMRHILPSVDQSLAQLGGATVLTKLDANSGFWQVKLDLSQPSSQPLSHLLEGSVLVASHLASPQPLRCQASSAMLKEASA